MNIGALLQLFDKTKTLSTSIHRAQAKLSIPFFAPISLQIRRKVGGKQG